MSPLSQLFFPGEHEGLWGLAMKIHSHLHLHLQDQEQIRQSRSLGIEFWAKKRILKRCADMAIFCLLFRFSGAGTRGWFYFSDCSWASPGRGYSERARFKWNTSFLNLGPFPLEWETTRLYAGSFMRKCEGSALWIQKATFVQGSFYLFLSKHITQDGLKLQAVDDAALCYSSFCSVTFMWIFVILHR